MKKPSIRAWLSTALIIISSTIGFTQSVESPLSLYQKGHSLAAKNPKKAYPLLVSAMKFSKQNNDWNLYLHAVNALSGLALGGKEDQQKEAFAWAIEALDILKAAKRDTALAKLHYNVAEFYYVNGEIELALSHYEVSIKILKLSIGEWNRQVAECYRRLGDVFKYKKSDFREAERCYEKALQIWEKIEFHDHVELFRNYYSLSTTNKSQRDFEKALSYSSKALEIAKKMNSDTRMEMINGVIANIYRDMGESALAKQHYQIAITLNKKTNDQKTLAWYYQGLGETLKNDSLYDEAIDNFSKAHSIYVKQPVNQNLLVYLLKLIAETYALKQDDKEFHQAINDFFEKLQTFGMVRGRLPSDGLVILGDYNMRKLRYDSALYFYQRALIASVHSFHSDKVEDNPSEAMIGFDYYNYGILAKKALALKGKFIKSNKLPYLQQSLDCLMLAEKLLSQERNMLDMEDAKWKFLEENYDIYEDIISSLYEGREFLNTDTLFAQVFRYFEQSKSRSLADALIDTERTIQISNQDSLFDLHAALKRKLLSVQDKLSIELEKIDDSKKIKKLREEIVMLDRNIQDCKLSIEEEYPGYFNVKYGYKTPVLQDVQNLMKGQKQILIEYFWGTEWVYVLGVGGDEILFKRIGRPDSIKAIINSVLSHLEEKHSSINKEAFGLYTSRSHQLYKLLVEPVKAILPIEGRIQIIPDGSISQVPFEILLEEKARSGAVNYHSLKYMIKSYAIGYAYSSSKLVYKSRGPVRKPSVLALGFTGGRRLRAAGPELEEIQGVEQELEALAKRFNKGEFLVGKDATETNFKILSPEFDIIHLAIHGRSDVKRNYSASLFFRSKYDSLEDGELHAYELYGLKLKALLAVLSACESGLGKGYKGEGMISMASAFMYSGCENILMSLWKVNDQASTILMDDFYSQLLEGKTIDEALRQAKLNYLMTADELTADPKVWAPLVAYGSLDQVFQKDRSKTYIVVSLLTLAVLLLVLIKKKR